MLSTPYGRHGAEVETEGQKERGRQRGRERKRHRHIGRREEAVERKAQIV